MPGGAQMDSARLNDWLQVIGIFALVASLIFVGLQMKQTQQIGEGEAAAYYSEITSSFRNTVIDYPEVWRSGCMGEELSDGDQTRFAQMYYSYLSAAYWLWIANDVGIIQAKTNVLTNAFAANIHRYPGIAKMNASKRLWSLEGSKLDLLSLQRFSAEIQTRLAELEKIESDPLSDPDWCGNFS
jgi:hypothetical protein